jgi:5-methylcytosine-specific restriction endonuclease McrA
MNDELAEVEPLGRLLFAGLWCIADREGRLEDRPKRIKAEVLPYDDCDVDDLLNKLAEREFIIRYEVNGEKYIQVVNFIKHQNPHYKEVPSEIPAPEGHIDSEYKSPPPTEAERQAIFKRDGFKCIICGATDNLTLDHIIPRSKGGTSEPENLQTLCKRCNTSKGNKLDFMSAQQEGNGGLTSIQPRTELEPNSVRDGTLIPDSLNLIPDSLKRIEEGLKEPSPSPSSQERECLKIIKEVKNYPFDYAKDLEYLRSLAVDFPTVDIISELKKWCTYKLDHPLKKKANPRLQIRNWLENSIKWSKDERASPVGQTGQPDKFEGIYLT